MTSGPTPKILVLCTVSAGLDAVAEVIRRGFSVSGIVGVHPEVADPVGISGYVDVAQFAAQIGVPHYYVRSYSLNSDVDRSSLQALDFDLIWVSGWQRLVPKWLIESSKLGVLGGHGSPDGIHGGRGRSPQNWALMLGCERFDIALFRITPGVDEGPVVAQRSFYYHESDDIAISYYRSALAMADMVCEVLRAPEALMTAIPQPAEAYFYPKRTPEDGWVDWSLPKTWVVRHCRALTTPYPGLRTSHEDVEIILWQCQPFDDRIDGPTGTISACFTSGDFLVNCRDGRVLVRKWTTRTADWRPQAGMQLRSVPFQQQLAVIIERHRQKYPHQRISERIERWRNAK